MISEENRDLEKDADEIVKESSEFLKQEQYGKSGSENKTPEVKISASSPKAKEYTETSENIKNINQIPTKKNVDNNPFPSSYSPISESPETPDVNLDEDSIQKFFDMTADVVDAPTKKMEQIIQDNKTIGENEQKDNSTADLSDKASMSSKVEVDIFPDLQLESPCRSNSLSKISSAVSASKAARKLKQQRTMSKDRSEDSKH